MSTITLKTQIQELLAEVEDERFLQSINAMLHTYLSNDPIMLNAQEEEAIEEGERDITAGHVVSHQEVIQNSRQRYTVLKPRAWK